MTAQPKKKHQALFGLRKNKQQLSVKKTQFPLTLPWTCTVPKVQGLSLAEGALRFDLEKQKSFNQGQIYVALSRSLSMNKNVFNNIKQQGRTESK